MKLKATPIEGGFALRLMGDGCLGEALNGADPESVVVEMMDGQTLHLYEALLAMIQSRVIAFVVLTEPVRQRPEEWLN